MWWLKGGEGTAEGNQDNGAAVLDSTTISEMKEQFEQQQQLVQQLKDLLRENEQQLRKKEQTLEESATKLSKIKLQHKAKIAQLTNQLQEAQKKVTPSSVKQQKSEDDKIQEPTSTVDTSRGKVLMLKKQLEESRLMFEKRQQEMANSEHLLENMRLQLQERDQLIAQLKSEKFSADAEVEMEKPNRTENNQRDTDVKEMYAQIVYKDSKIMELDNLILELERNVIDLQEHIKEKEEVIQARNKAIQLMTEDLSRRGKVVVDQLDDTRDQMRVMQDNFASMEDEWKREKVVLTEQFAATRAQLEKQLADKEISIADLKVSLSKLDGVRFELSTRNAELQEKLVRLQELFEKSNSKLVENSDTDVPSLQNDLMQLREELKKKESIIIELQQSAGGSTKANNQKLLKLKAQQKSQIRALEAQINELKNGGDTAQQVTILQNRIADLEEKKGNLELKLVNFEELITSLGQHQKLIQELKEKLHQQSSDLDSHVKMISILQNEKLDLMEQSAAREKYNAELDTTKSIIADEFQTLQDSKISLELKLVELEESRDDDEKARQALLSQIDGLMTQLAQVQEPLLVIEQEKLELQKTNQELENKMVEVQQALEENRSEVNLLKEELNAKNEQIKTLSEHLDVELTRHTEILKSLNEEQLSIKQSLTNENEELKLEKERLNLILQEKEDSVLRLNEELDKSSNSKLELVSDLTNKNELISKLTQELSLFKENQNLEGRTVDNRVASLVEQLAEMEAEINKLQVNCKESEIQLETLCREKDLATAEMNQWKEMTIEKNREFEKILSEKDASLAQLNEQLQAFLKDKDVQIQLLTDNLKAKDEQLTVAVNNLAVIEENLSKMTAQLQTSQYRLSDVAAECQQLQLIISEKNGEIGRLENAVKDKDSLCRKYQTDLQNTSIALEESQKRLSDCSEMCRVLEENIAILQQSKETLEQKANTWQDELVSLKDMLTNSEEEVGHLYEELNNSRNNVKSLGKKLEEEVEMVKQNFESQILAAHNEFETRLASKQADINQLSSKLEILQSEEGHQETNIKQLEKSISQLKSELENSNSRIEELTNKLVEYEVSENSMQLDVDTLKEKNVKLAAVHIANTMSLENLMQELTKTKSDLEQASSSMEERNAEIENSNSRIEELTNKLVEYEVRENSLQLDVDSLKEKNVKLATVHIANTMSLGNLMQELTKTKIDLERASSCMEERNAEMENSSSTLENLVLELADLRSQLDLMKSEKEAVASEKSGVDEELHGASARITELLSELESSRASVADSEIELGELQQKYEQCICRHDSEIAQYKLSISHLEGKVSHLRSQLQADEYKYRENVELLQLELQEKENALSDGSSALALALENVSAIEQEKANLESERRDLLKAVERLQFFEAEFHKSLEMASASETKIQQLSEEKCRLQDRLDRLMEYNQQIESDLASTCEAAKMAESDRDAISAELGSKITELEVIVSDRNEELENQLLRAESMKNEMVTLTSEKAGLNAEFADLQAAHNSLQMELLEVREQVTILNENADGLHSELAKIREERDLLLNEKEQTFQLLERQVDELQEQERKASVIAEETRHHKQEKQSLVDKIASLEKALEIANEVIHNKTIEISELNQSKFSLDESNADFSEQIKNLQSELRDNAVAFSDLKATAQDLQLRLNESTIQNQELNLQVQQMNEHMQGLQASSSDQVQSLSTQLDTANKEVQSLQSEILSNSQLLKDTLLKMDEISQELLEKKVQVDRHEQVILQLKDEMLNKNTRLNELENECQENAFLTEKLESLRQELKNASECTQELESLVAQLKNEKMNQDNRIHELHCENEHLQNQLMEKETLMETLNCSTEMLKARLSECEIEIRELWLEIQQKSALVESLQSRSLDKVQHLSEQLEAANVEIKNLQTENHVRASLLEEMELKMERFVSLEEEASQLRDELLAKNALIVEMETCTHESDSKLQMLQSELLDKEDNISKLQQNLQDKQKKLLDLESECMLMEDLRHLLQDTELQLQSVQNGNLSLQEQVKLGEAAANERLSAYETELANLKESLQVSSNTNQNLELSVETFKSEFEKIHSQLHQDSQAVDYISQLKSELQSAVQAKQTLQNLHESQTAVIEESSIHKQQLEMQLGELQAMIERLKSQHDMTISQLSQEIELLTDEKTSLESKCQSLVLKVEASESHNAELNQETEKLNEDLTNLRQSSTELKSLTLTLNEENRQLQLQLGDIIANQKEAGKTVEDQLVLQQEMQKLEVEVKQLREERSLYQEQFQAVMENIGKLNDEKLRIEEVVKMLQADLQNASERNEEDRLQLQKLKLENSDLKSRHEVLTEELHLLQDKEESREKLCEEAEKLCEEHQRYALSVSTERLLGSPSESSETLQSSALPSLNHQELPDGSPEHLQMKHQLAVLQIKNEKMLAKLKIFKNKNDKLNLTLNDMLTTQQSLTDEKVRLVEFNKRAQDEIKHLSTELRNLERLWKTEVKMLQDRLDTVEVANSKLVEIKEDIERKLVEQINRNADLQKVKDGLEKNFSTCMESLESKHNESFNQLKLKHDQLHRQVESLQVHNKFLESDNLEFQRLIEKLQVEKSKFDHELKAQAEKYVPLLQEHNKLKEVLAGLQLQDVAAVADLKTNYNSLQKDYKDLLNIKAQLETEVEDLKTELDAAVKDSVRLERERNELRMTLNETQTSLIADGDKSLDMTNELEDLKSANAALCKSVESLQNELVSLRQDNQQNRNQFGEPLELQEPQQDGNDFINLEIGMQDLKVQNADLLTRISTLEGEIWRLEEEKQHVIEEASSSEEQAVKKLEAELEKVQLDNTRLLEELEALDSDWKNVENEKEQIEAESRLTFQQQQETIKGLRNQLSQLKEKISERNNLDLLSELQAKLSEVNDKLGKTMLQLKVETEKATYLESQNYILHEKVTDFSNKIGVLQDEKETLIAQVEGLKLEKCSLEQQLDHWKLQHQNKLAEERHQDRLQTEVLQRSLQSEELESLRSAEEEQQRLKIQVAELQVELQHTMHSLHAKDVRCEDLTSEIMQLIEERDSLQLRLSSLLRADQQKEMRIKFLEMSTNVSRQSDFTDSVSEPKTPFNESPRLDLNDGTLTQRLHESEEKYKELQQMNAVLDQALAAERECRLKVAADLKFANEELAALGRGPKLKTETVLSFNEEKVPLLPEHSQTLVRSYTGTTWRIANWIQGRSLPRVMHV